MEISNIYFRKGDVAGAWSTVLGPAYDSGNNAVDWAVHSGGLNLVPRTTGSPSLPVTAGDTVGRSLCFCR
jgi:hypothetical protein